MRRYLDCWTFRVFAVALATLSATACTQRFYRGPQLPAGDVVLIHIGDTTVLEIDGRYASMTALGTQRLELAPGPHRVVLGFDRKARSIGMRDVPAAKGAGKCTLDFVAEAGQQYWLGTNAIGTDWTMRNWDGKWEGWIRDPSVADNGGTIARCTPRPVGEKIPLPASARVAPAPEIARPAMPAPAPAAAPPTPGIVAPAPPVPSPAAAAVQGQGNEGIRVGTWSLRGAERRDYDAIAATIDGNFDILTLTTVAPASASNGDYDQLMAALGASWQSLVTEDIAAGVVQHYAILYRRGRVRPCAGWERLRHRAHGNGDERPRQDEGQICFEGYVLDLPRQLGGVTDYLPLALRIRE